MDGDFDRRNPAHLKELRDAQLATIAIFEAPESQTPQPVRDAARQRLVDIEGELASLETKRT